MGQMEMKCIFNIGKKYFYIGQGKATQVSDVAHGPLVHSYAHQNDVTQVSTVAYKPLTITNKIKKNGS
jgi:hypothetical protein